MSDFFSKPDEASPWRAMPRPVVMGAAAVLVAAAVSALVLGALKSGPASRTDTETFDPAQPIAGATTAKALSTPALDETEVRRLAREEAQALLRAAPKKAAPAVADGADDEPDPSGPAKPQPYGAATLAKPATGGAPVTPPPAKPVPF